MIALVARAVQRAPLTFCSGVLLLTGCATEPTRLHIPAPEAAEFQMEAYPVLLRDCGFPECHGDVRRFFRVFGPGRSRLAAGTPILDEPTEAELMQSYDRARSMLANVGNPTDALLLRKPLARAAGGQGHEGENRYGENVYRTKDDPGYQALLRWALSTKQAPAEAE